MLSAAEILKLEFPPNLTDEEMQAWMLEQVREPDGSLIMNDEPWAEEPSKAE